MIMTAMGGFAFVWAFKPVYQRVFGNRLWSMSCLVLGLLVWQLSLNKALSCGILTNQGRWFELERAEERENDLRYA